MFGEQQIKTQYLVSVSFFLDTMENWDEKKLEEVVNKKHGEAEKKKPKTQIVCSFLELSGFIFRDNHVARCLLLFWVGLFVMLLGLFIKIEGGLSFVLGWTCVGYRVKFLFRSRL